MNESSHRVRSRSPAKRRPGFRWKEKRRGDDDRDVVNERDERHLARGYRERSPRNHHDGRGREERKNDGKTDGQKDRDHKEKKKEKKQKKAAAAAAQSSEPMIVVNVNDRLGTKAAIPCLPSDPISMSGPATNRSFVVT